MPKCRINGCLPQISVESISYFSVPYIQPSRKQWIDAIQQHQEFDYYAGRFYVCHLHFGPDDLNIHGNRRTVKKGRLPSIFPINSANTHECTGKADDLVEASSRNEETIYEDPLWQLNIINLLDDDNNENNNLDVTTDVVVSKEKYKELVENSVKFIKFKEATEQLQKKLEEKSAKIKELGKVIRRHEYLLKKKLSDKKEPKQKNERECNSSKQLEILRCLRFGNEFKKYSPDVRLFCLTLHYYSPRAYEYVRSVFNLNLPASRSIRSWLSSLDCSPGFTECVFDTLYGMAEEHKSGNKLIVGLIFDEMKIRSQSQYDHATKTFLGHSNAGKSNELGDYSSLSNEALVLTSIAQ